MKITLENFKCYEKKEFDLGDNNMVLISGVSGRGKSTILDAINFCLFGKGSKLIKVGKKSCKVEIDMATHIITRTKRPNILNLANKESAKKYIEEAAQTIINEKFTEFYNVIGYVSQTALNTFILLSPKDKLKFLEKFAFSGVDLDRVKRDSKEIIKQNSEKLLVKKGMMENSLNVLEELESTKKELVVYPFNKGKVPTKLSNQERLEKNENTRLKNSRTKMKRSTKNISALNKKLRDASVNNVNYDALEEKINFMESAVIKYNKKYFELCGKINEKQMKNYETELEKIMINIENRIVKNNILQLEKEKERVKKEDIQMLKNIIQNKNNLWSEMDPKEVDDTISNLKECYSDLKIIDNLEKGYKKSNTENIESDISLHQELAKKYSTKYECPECKKKLYMDNEILLPCENETVTLQDKSESERIKRELRLLREKLKSMQFIDERNSEIRKEVSLIKNRYEEDVSYESVKEDLRWVNEYKKEQMQLEEEVNDACEKMEKNVYSDKYYSIVNKLKKLSISETKLDYIPERDETEIRKYISEQKEYIRNCKQISLQKKELETKIHNCKQKKIGKSKISEMELEEEINKENTIIEQLEKDIELRIKNLKMLENWKNYHTNMCYIKKHKIKHEQIKKDIKRCEKNLIGSERFYSLILRSESIALQKVIDTINSHAQIYIDLFFSSEPMMCRLRAFKKVKKNKCLKPQISLEIDYKGMDGCDINMLSGGELSRVVLAYTLALSEMTNIPILMLDECTASLDGETTDEVFEAIRENFRGKMIIIIAHQVVTGSFDKTICL
jgi:DNA repair protein SbcC/Rad50